jgi:hypothetical protein
MDSPGHEQLPPLIRACWAIVLGALGFLTGLLAVWVFSDLPGVSFPDGTSLWVGAALGLGCLVAGYLRSEKTFDALGDAWNALWQLSVGILATLRALIR